MQVLVYMDEEDIYYYSIFLEKQKKYKNKEISSEELQEYKNNFWNKYLISKYGILKNVPLAIDDTHKTIYTFNHQNELFQF